MLRSERIIYIFEEEEKNHSQTVGASLTPEFSFEVTTQLEI